MTDKFDVIDDGERRHYYSQIPNIINDADLSPAAYRLYGQLKRVAGSRDSGYCSCSIETLAKDCRMSKTTITKAKQELLKSRLIKVEETQGKHGEFSSHIIRIVDIWEINEEIYRAIKERTFDAAEICKKFSFVESTEDKESDTNFWYRTVTEIGIGPYHKLVLKNNISKNNQEKKEKDRREKSAPVRPEPIQDPAPQSNPEPPTESPNQEEPMRGDNLFFTERQISAKANDGKEKPANPAQARVAGTANAIVTGYQAQVAREQAGEIAPDYFPPEVQAVLARFYRYWRVKLPPIPKGSKGGVYAEWIKEGKLILSACAGYDSAMIIDKVWEKFRADEKKQGRPPYTVGRPRGIITECAGIVAALERAKQDAVPAEKIVNPSGFDFSGAFEKGLFDENSN